MRWQAFETSIPAEYNDNPTFLWEVAAVDETGEPLAVIAESMTEKYARLVSAAPDMLAMLQRLTHPAASEEDRDDALELIRKLKGLQ